MVDPRGGAYTVGLGVVQNLAVFLMADGCEWLTGQTIALDGAGWLANGASFTELSAWTDADWAKAREAIAAPLMAPAEVPLMMGKRLPRRPAPHSRRINWMACSTPAW